MTGTDTFYRVSGTSPPGEDRVALDSARASESPSVPPELVEDLARFLADAIVADIRQFPNLAELKAKPHPTVESPSGLNRSHPPARRKRARQEPRMVNRHSTS